MSIKLYNIFKKKKQVHKALLLKLFLMKFIFQKSSFIGGLSNVVGILKPRKVFQSTSCLKLVLMEC